MPVGGVIMQLLIFNRDGQLKGRPVFSHKSDANNVLQMLLDFGFKFEDDTNAIKAFFVEKPKPVEEESCDYLNLFWQY